jgi:hypothetical protein
MDTSMDEVEADQSISRVYANANLERLPEYYEYDRLQVQWGSVTEVKTIYNLVFNRNVHIY